MSNPSTYIKQNDVDSHQRSPSWCAAIVRFMNPAAMYSTNPLAAFAEKKMSVIENDIISVSINRPKNGMAKTASMVVKVTDINHAYSLAPGDWVFIWMSDWQEDINKILAALHDIDNPTQARLLNDWESGLKFVGRILELPATDTIVSNGTRTLVQHIQCQAHLELASSVYYTFVAQIAINPGQNLPEVVGSETLIEGNIKAKTAASKKAEAAQNAHLQKIQKNQNARKLTKNQGINATGDDIAERILSYYQDKHNWTPDMMISTLLILLLGINRDDNIVNQFGARGTFQDAIGIPASVAKILNRRGKTKLWQTYTMIMGLQTYTSHENQTKAQSLNPVFKKADQIGDNIFYRTTDPCKGFVPFVYSPILDNGTIWSTIGQYLNPTVNEMYTCLRINPAGMIMPTLIVREQPFSTKMYHQIEGFIRREMKAIKKKEKEFQAQKGLYDEQTKGKKGNAANTAGPAPANQPPDAMSKTKQLVVEASTDASAIGRNAKRTMYANLPRWVIDESLIASVNVAVSESKRINFVQVWGRSKGAEFSGAGFVPPEMWKITQYALVNYAADLNDISRNGLRADITETEFDIIGPNNVNTGNENLASLAPTFAKMRADWLFNGHLKPAGTVSCMGIKEPICEGDNLEIRGTVYHIESLSFNGSLTANGNKSFTTTIQVSNGILARTIDSTNPKEMPQYPRSVGGLRYSDELNGYQMPGVTDVQNTHLRKGYDQDGEAFAYPKKNDEEES